MTAAYSPRGRQVHYPILNGFPLAESDWHRDVIGDLIKTLRRWFQGRPRVYVSGKILVFYIPGNRSFNLVPDVFVVRGVRNHPRSEYVIWEEGKGLDLMIELASPLPAEREVTSKLELNRVGLGVREFFLFDPDGDGPQPSLQGHRLRKGKYVVIEPVAGRLPSKVLGLHLEQNGPELRLYDPGAESWLPTPDEALEQAKAEVERLRGELEELRRHQGGRP